MVAKIDFLKHVFLCLVSLCAFLYEDVSISKASTTNWHPQISKGALPPRIVAVDKSQQQFYLYDEKQNDATLELTHNYPCTTGQVDGDKQVVNDLRTPEGVYFVVYKIAKGLDFKEYGGIAYTLNYPNPVDKLRGKTGYGIWIHSKGDGITPRITRGCIAIGLEEIDTVGPLLTSGTAVVVGEKLTPAAVPANDDGTVQHLRRRMEQWTRAWANRSADFFEFYDGESYTQAMPETFKAFRSNKERLFKRLAWINIFNREVHVLEGPGYWVTWSEQFYRAPNLSTEGIRRLYWQRDANNVFRIVGMEWIPSNLGMQAAFEKGELVAENAQSTDASATGTKEEKPTAPPLSMPEKEGDTPPTSLVAEAKPSTVVVATPEQKATVLAGGSITTPKPVPAPQKPVKEEPSNNTQDLTPELQSLIQQKHAAWEKAWQARDTKSFYAFYDKERFGKEAGQTYANAYADLQKIMAPYFKEAWVELLGSAPVISMDKNYIKTVNEQWIFISGQKPSQGVHTLFWQKDSLGDWRIVASEWNDKVGSMQVEYLEKVSAEIGSMIEAWRQAWLKADVKAYLTFYAENAWQGGRNKKGIGTQKGRVWKKAPPAKIELTGMRVLIVKNGIQVDMEQVYEDAQGRGDTGTKTLLLTPSPTGWKIHKEDWSATSS